MMYINDYEIDTLLRRAGHESYQYRAAVILRYFKEAVDSCSDGWAHWAAPVNAAQQLIEIATNDDDCTPQEWNRAVGAIKRFYTTKGNRLGVPKLRCLED
jgi:hypothetical protein